MSTVPEQPATPPHADATGAAPRTVRRFASVIRLRPEKEAEYRALHADAWPRVLATLKAARIGNYSIFLRDGLLFSYLEYDGDDYDADQALIAADPATRRWWELTDPCQQPLDSAAPGETWAPAEEVFHLD
ncbi:MULTISPECIES: L-rhamnose mutarotase [Streptomyces]|uniref:L-rhamnose mutarotase n=1 Tax=Streptomyces evansiae TaxID=3075535 RepID=A0ABU2R4K5_9ACTN|nr:MULTISPECIES: L-rhamnose mutarotase [unclassified Streptomyces]MDT0410205.1 L-rhamnose mutarotase [Streptomyces sp. DSM 41979]MYQ58767.1 L-rhamnose mutarotase [Streptomyces sp. SID4926]SCE28834.1 L-rhamnose mutarotase [Streptomyces sp. DfronAA-171]